RRDKIRGGAPRGERVPLGALPRPKRARVATSDRVVRLKRHCAFRRSASLRLRGGKDFRGVGKARMQTHRENDETHPAPLSRGRDKHKNDDDQTTEEKTWTARPVEQAAHAGRGSRAARGRVRSDPAALCRITAAVAFLPARLLPAP